MSDEQTPPSEWARQRAAGKAPRAKRIERREAYFDLLMSGYSVQQIARATKTSRFAVRRAIDQALADRRLDGQEDFARPQVARLNKALRCADISLERGDLKAVPHFLRVVSELDRYHGLASPARLAEPIRHAETPRLAAPPLKLAHAPETDAPCRARSLSAPRGLDEPALHEMCAKEHVSS